MVWATESMSPRKLSLAQWLAELPGREQGHLLIGATGHLSLTLDERAAASVRLTEDVLPTLMARCQPSRVTLLTGLAPGADLLFKQTASEWLSRAGVPFDTVAALPVPVDVLVDDWTRRIEDEPEVMAGDSVATVREALRVQLERCAVIVDLLPDPDAARRLLDPTFRQQQYRRLAACLAEQSDVLVAIQRPGHAPLPGGTTEVVEWRQHPARIPPAWSTLRWRRPGDAGRALLIIDPTPGDGLPGDPLTAALALCHRAFKAGNYLLCHDLARQAQGEGLHDRQLDYIALLSLANAGSTQLAMRRYRELAIVDGPDLEEWLALGGRLYKDLALSSRGARARELFERAGRVYQVAFERTGGFFPGINAASMLMLGGCSDEAIRLATKVIDCLRRLPDSETDAYYQLATEAEAALLLGDLPRARAALTGADALLRGNVNVRSRTVTQLRLLCRHLGCNDSLTHLLSLAPVYYVPLSLPPELPAAAFPADASLVYGGLSSPADLVVAEQFQQRGIRVHLVLPTTRSKLIERWQRDHGSDIGSRLIRCLEDAAECSVAQGFLEDEADWCAAYVSATACGLSRLAAQRLGCRWQVFGSAPRDRDANDRDAGDQDDDGGNAVGAAWVRRLDEPGQMTTASDGSPVLRRFVGTLFADFAGYSRLAEQDLPVFQAVMIGGIADQLRPHAGHILLQHTWGDAVHIVTDDAATVATVAADIHALVDRVRPTLPGMLGKLELRLSAHYAPVHEGLDAVESSTTYFGSQLSFAARVEPVTPPGMIFVTEAFAARLALEAPERYTTEYAGEIELAKRYGKYRLYSLRRGDLLV